MPKSSVRTSISAEYRSLKNGKYQGVVVQSFIGRISSDNYEFPCVNEYSTKEEALREAKQLVEKSSHSLEEVVCTLVPLEAQFASL